MTTTPQKISFGEMRGVGVRDVLIYCRDHRCTHHMTMSADRWPDHVRLSDVEPTFTCTRCGKRGADIRPSFPQARMGTGASWLAHPTTDAASASTTMAPTATMKINVSYSDATSRPVRQ